MPEPQLTMCLCNWRRLDQLAQVAAELKQQTLPTTVVVWNNDPTRTLRPMADFDGNVDWVINSSKNAHVRHVPALWQMATTSFVGRMDDDLHFADNRVLEDALEVLKAKKDHTRIVGAYGVRVFQNGTYSNGQQVSVPKGHGQHESKDGPTKKEPDDLQVDLVKGRFMLLYRKASKYLLSNCPHYHADLYFSARLAGRRRWWHTLAGCLYDREKREGRLIDFPEDDKGYCRMPEHLEMRDKVTDDWVKQCVYDHRVKPLARLIGPDDIEAPEVASE